MARSLYVMSRCACTIANEHTNNQTNDDNETMTNTSTNTMPHTTNNTNTNTTTTMTIWDLTNNKDKTMACTNIGADPDLVIIRRLRPILILRLL